MFDLLVVGGTGFLGAELGRLAGARGARVAATEHLRARPFDADEVSFFVVDIADEAAIAELVRSTRPATVVNAAYVQRGPDMRTVCADGAGHVARAATAIGSRLVHVSTDLVFDGTLGRPYRPSDEARPVMPYGAAKLEGEKQVLSAEPGALVARTSLIYGAPDAPQERLVADALAGDDIAFFVDEWRSPVHVGELAAALLDLAELPVSGLVHVGSDSRIDRHRFAALLARHAGQDAGNLRARTQDPSLGPRPADVSLDSSATFAALGRRLRSPEEILGDRP